MYSLPDIAARNTNNTNEVHADSVARETVLFRLLATSHIKNTDKKSTSTLHENGGHAITIIASPIHVAPIRKPAAQCRV
jgi:hypothetical protein